MDERYPLLRKIYGQDSISIDFVSENVFSILLWYNDEEDDAYETSDEFRILNKTNDINIKAFEHAYNPKNSLTETEMYTVLGDSLENVVLHMTKISD